jgi:glycosyltransferase involved in cell wall biosynthesis
VDGTIRIVGNLPRQEVLQEFLENDVLVLLSETEGMPQSLLEAMATGCVPVVAKLEEHSPTLIQDGVNGCVIQGRDYGDWADAIERLWKDPSLRSELSKNAQYTIARDFTAEKSVKKFDEVLCDVLRDVTSGQYERPPTLRARSGYGDILPPPEISQSKLPWES